MSVSFGFSRGELIRVRVLLEHAGRAVLARMALDTGARVTVIAPSVAQELGFGPDELRPDKNVSGATGRASGAIIRVESVSVRGLGVSDLAVLCLQLTPSLRLEGVLGLDFLGAFNIEIDNRTETVTLTRWRT